MTSDRHGEALEQGPQPAQGVLERAVPAAQPERGEQQRHHDDAGVLGEQEEGEPQPGVLGPGAHDELGVGHRHVERRALQLGDGGDEEDDRAGQLPQHPPRRPAVGEREQRQRAAGQRHRRDGEHDRQLVRHSWAAARRPPSRAYLLALAQPAISVPRAPTEVAASTSTTEPGTSIGGDARGDRDGRERDEVRDQRDRRGEPEDPPVGGARGDVLLLHELHAVGDELRPAVVAAGVHRAEPALHVGHHLVLGLPDEQRQHEEGREHRQRPHRHLEQAHRGPHSGGGTPGACTRRRLGDFADSWPSPGSFPPGQGFEARAASWNDLRSGVPSNPSGSSSGRIDRPLPSS